MHQFIGLLIVLLFTAPTLASETAGNDAVKVARSFKDGGGYNRKWSGSGSPEEIRHAGERILAKGEGTYCCGFTFAVAMRIAKERGLLQGKTADEIRRFQMLWYGSTDEDREVLCAFAAKDLGIGQQTPLAKAQPGDFVQLWRTSGSGHSVIFLNWVREEGNIVGFRYRSSQGSTNGIADKTEYFADAPGRDKGMVRERTHVCRLAESPSRE